MTTPSTDPTPTIPNDHPPINNKTGGKSESKKEYVLQPRQTDVLCGRGGMSNHHAGNEWYRRLIKSNRPLYRACPKHTKLLVAKAVVQAVDQQGGRFLDKEKDTGLWYVVDYRRAVDKTSQGLRERERHGSDDNDDDNSGDNNNEDANGTIFHVAPTDVAALARQISLKDPAPGSSRWQANKSVTAAGLTANTASAPTNIAVTTATTATGGFAYEYPKEPAAAAAAYAAKWRRNNSITLASGAGKAKTASMVDKNEDEDSQVFDPLPPTMQPRQTSMLKFLQGTKLLEAPPDSDRKPAARPMVPAMDRVRAQQLLHKQQRNNSESEAATTLTRFQSQVSDWLTSFWPVNGGGATAAANATSYEDQHRHRQRVSTRKRKAAAVAALPEPTELETGASQVLLQMATSSKLFRGFSSLFEDNKPATKKRATDSLLDDYEESPMEARMRHMK